MRVRVGWWLYNRLLMHFDRMVSKLHRIQVVCGIDRINFLIYMPIWFTFFWLSILLFCWKYGVDFFTEVNSLVEFYWTLHLFEDFVCFLQTNQEHLAECFIIHHTELYPRLKIARNLVFTIIWRSNHIPFISEDLIKQLLVFTVKEESNFDAVLILAYIAIVVAELQVLIMAFRAY